MALWQAVGRPIKEPGHRFEGLPIKGGLTLERGGSKTVLDFRLLDDIISPTAMQVAAVYLERA